MCVCVCVCACVRACVRACVCGYCPDVSIFVQYILIDEFKQLIILVRMSLV